MHKAYRNILLLLTIVFSHQVVGQNNPVILRRICRNANNNNLFWQVVADPCPSFKFYIIWGRNGATGPYIPIDTVTAFTDETYTHINANIGPTDPDWRYFIERRDSCGPVYNHISDTVPFDITQPDPTYIDSVSVDINTNKVIIGWSKNLTPDFDKYEIYKFGTTIEPVVTGGTRDTFIIDNLPGSNPSSDSIRYDMTTADSCGNRRSFGFNPHVTILLRNTVDTCLKQTSLRWTKYVGWANIRKHYIFRKENTGAFTLIDSVDASQFTYTDPINLGSSYEYFIRAVKDTTFFLSSSSNKISFVTRARTEPTNPFISFVSFNTPIDEQVILSYGIPPGQEAKKFDILISENGTTFNTLQTINYTSAPVNISLALGLQKYLFKVRSYNICDLPYAESDSSCTIFLKGSEAQTDAVLLTWNPYFTWNTGTVKHRIFRGTDLITQGNIVFEPLDSVFPDTSYTDKSLPELIGPSGVCYFIEAVKSPETDNIVSRSNIYCRTGEMKVFVPNAFRPSGINNLFRPEGMYIDYQNSEMEIYNRWGQQIYKDKVLSGWDGKDMNHHICSPDMYFYKLLIIGTNGQQERKTGSITLLE